MRPPGDDASLVFSIVPGKRSINSSYDEFSTEQHSDETLKWGLCQNSVKEKSSYVGMGVGGGVGEKVSVIYLSLWCTYGTLW